MFDVLIVGCGRIAGNGAPPRADSYGQTILDSPDFRLAACVDSSSDKAQRFAATYGCSSFVTLTDALTSKRMDVVVISSPDSQHFDTLLEVVSHQLCPPAIIVEKPLCVSSQEMRVLAGLQVPSGSSIFVNHPRRLDPRYRRLRQLIREDRFGQLLKARAVYYGGWLHNGIHVVDTLTYLLGSPPEWTAVTGVEPGRSSRDPSWSLLGGLPEGSASIEVEAVDERFYQIFEFDLRFEYGRVRIDNFDEVFRVEEVLTNNEYERVLVNGRDAWPNDGKVPTARLIAHVGAHLRGNAHEEGSDLMLASAIGSMNSLWKGAAIGQQG